MSSDLVNRAARHLHTRRAPGGRPAATAWRCEGRWQCDDQMDIWQCLDETDDETDEDQQEV